MPSPFEVLDVEPDASEAEIDRAYRRRVKESHPDLGGSVAEFRAVTEAYDRLSTGDASPTDVDAQATARATRADRDTAAPGRAAGGRDRSAGGEETDAAAGTHVEYLDFDVVVDRGWDVDDPDLFEKAAALDLDAADYGSFRVGPDQTLLAAAEADGHAWPYSCRGGACANCAVAVLEGELSTPVNHVLPEEMIDRDLRLSCVGEPLTAELRVVYNVKHLPELDELRLPPHPSD